MTNLWAISKNDFVQSLINAGFCAIVVGLAGIVSQPGFNVFEAPWLEILSNMVNIAIVTAIGTMAKKFSTSENGKTFGRF